MPLAWQMGAKTWQHPEAHKRFVEQEKAKAAAAKKSREEAKLAKEVEKEQRQLMRKQLVDQTRAQREAKKDEYLAQLKADVARLEMKRTGDTPERRIALFDKTRAAKQVEEREKEVGKEVELSALEMLALKEKELEEKHKEQEEHLAELADRRRRELLDYKHALGLSSAGPHPPQRPKRFPGRPLSLLDDPEFWRLPDSDRHRLEIMPPEERVQYGFGPYEEDELENEPAPRQQFTGPTAVPESSEEQLAHRVRDFVFTADPSPPGMSATADEPITLSLPIEGIPDLSTLGAEDRRTAHLIVQDESKHLRDELARHAIEEFDANALVHFAESGLVPVEAEELVQAGFIYELRAQGIPARLSHAPHAPASAHKTRFNRPSHAGGVPHNPWGGPGPSNGNGGAGWHDEPLFGALGGGGAPGGHGGADWGAAGGIGGGHAGGWGAMGGTGGARNLPGAWASGATGGRGWAGGGAGAGGGHAGGGAVWHGLPKHPHTAGPSFRPAPHTQAPPELHSLPWGAQQYVKKVREQREREEREMTQASGARFATHLHPTAHAHAAAHPLPVEDPALFGSAFLHPSYATSPRPHGLPHASSHPLPARAETQRAMVDPDDGGAGGPPGPTGLGAGATPAAAALPTAPAAAAPAAAKGWDGLTGWLTGAGRGGAAAEAAPVPQAGAADDLRAGQPW